MSKRGIGGEVDWIVAIGLFLVFMGVVLTLFRPGIQPVFDHTALQTIVEENFLNDTGWTIYKQPIFLESLIFQKGSGSCETTVCLGKVVLAFDGIRRFNGNEINDGFPVFVQSFANRPASEIAKFVKVFFVNEGEKGYGIIGGEATEEGERVGATDEEKHGLQKNAGEDSKLSQLSSQKDLYKRAQGNISGETREKVGEVYVKYGIDGKDLLLETRVRDGIKKYIIVYANEQINYDGAPLTSSGQKKYACMFQDEGEVYGGTDCQAKYSLGVRETAQGISLKKIALLGTDAACGQKSAYECVKAKWGFPGAKDFRIDVFTQAQVPLLIVNDFPIPTEAIVRVRQVNTFVLTEEGLKVPVTVSIKVW